jgi:hypothetical protein
VIPPDPTDAPAPVRRWVVWHPDSDTAIIATTEDDAWILAADELAPWTGEDWVADKLRVAGWLCSEVRTDGQ